MTATFEQAAQTGPDAPAARTGRIVRLLGTLVIVAGLVLGAAGAGTWAMVQTSLADENITVAEDAARFGGERVEGPLTASYEADVIEHHAREASKGKTYAELDRKDPVREVVMNGSFLRASLFTSVVSFGIAAMAMGLGIVFVLVGAALRARPDRRHRLTPHRSSAGPLDRTPAGRRDRRRDRPGGRGRRPSDTRRWRVRAGSPSVTGGVLAGRLLSTDPDCSEDLP